MRRYLRRCLLCGRCRCSCAEQRPAVPAVVSSAGLQGCARILSQKAPRGLCMPEMLGIWASLEQLHSSSDPVLEAAAPAAALFLPLFSVMLSKREMCPQTPIAFLTPAIAIAAQVHL